MFCIGFDPRRGVPLAAGLAVGLVIVYRWARILNFAQAEFGTVAAYVAFLLFEKLHWPYAVAAILAVTAVVGLGLVVEINPLDSRLSLDDARSGIDTDALHGGEIDDDACRRHVGF